MERHKPTAKEIANSLGGADNVSDYKIIDTTPYCDKKNHAQRSIANDNNGQHLKHWRKERRSGNIFTEKIIK